MALKTQSKKQRKIQAKAAKRSAKQLGKKASKQVAAREDAVRNLIENQDLHDDLRNLAEAAKTAYARVSSNPGAILQDKKVHSELRAGTSALLDAKGQLGGKKAKKAKKKGGFGGLFLVVVGSGIAVVTVPALRTKALDLVFGPEEELDYSVGSAAGTTSANGNGSVAGAATTPVSGS